MNTMIGEPYDEDSFAFSTAVLSDVFVEMPHLKAAKRQVQRLIRTGTGGHERKAMLILGPTGIGKTMLLNHIFGIEKYRAFRTPEGLVSPVIRIDARPNSTTKGIAELLLQELGDNRPSRGTEHDMILRVIKLLHKEKTQLIIIDEAQCLVSRAYAASDLLKHLLNQASCPILLVGLESTEQLRTSNRQFRDRCLPTIRLPAFDYTDKTQRAQWRGLLKKLQSEVKELEDAVDLSQRAVAAALNFGARGLLRELRQLIEEAIDIAVEGGTKVSIEELAEAFERRRSDESRDMVNPFREELPEMWKPAELSEGTDKTKAKRRTALAA